VMSSADKSAVDAANCFTSSRTTAIFLCYVGFFINQGMLVTSSKNKDGSFPYNPVTLVLLTESLKVCLCVGLYLREEGNSIATFTAAVTSNSRIFRLYFVPAGLYALYNILSFTNFQNFDPATYFLFMQLRTLATGVLFQFLFNKQLSSYQWLALVILTVGCIIQGLDFASLFGYSDASVESDRKINFFSFAMVLMLVQVFCSCFAGVYNEYLLKGMAGDVHTMVQNFFMYSDSVLINLMVLVYQGELGPALQSENLNQIFGNSTVLAIIVNNAIMGITVSLFLKYLNSVLKQFASAAEIAGSAFFGWMLFGIQIRTEMYVSILMVVVAIHMYSKYPLPSK